MPPPLLGVLRVFYGNLWGGFGANAERLVPYGGRGSVNCSWSRSIWPYLEEHVVTFILEQSPLRGGLFDSLI